ncbi:transposase IS116/IS110/IS902 family protein [Yersinia enterocolitica]|nr:transposase IS116/IS110/IS902 family protein [Yersinia enterocolitica]
MVPREFSSGGKQRLGRISKRGGRYFRYLLVHGARAVAAVIERHKDNMPWLYRLLNKKAYNVAVVAQANKNGTYFVVDAGSSYGISNLIRGLR